jgi:hypothetical protein
MADYPVKRIALLQFHRSWSVCVDRVRWLRRLNDGIQIYGLFGGAAGHRADAQRALGAEGVPVYALGPHEGDWAWRNTDLAVREWFKEFGHTVAFDVLHAIHWDLLLLAPLDDLYRHVPADAVGLTGIVPLAAIESRWHWTTRDVRRNEVAALEQMAIGRFASSAPLTACLGPGYSLPRSFVERYASIDVPAITHDELRLPMYARVLGFPTIDTGFYPAWFDEQSERVFNANGVEIADDAIARELADPRGRRAFHPVRREFAAAWPDGPSLAK